MQLSMGRTGRERRYTHEKVTGKLLYCSTVSIPVRYSQQAGKNVINFKGASERVQLCEKA